MKCPECAPADPLGSGACRTIRMDSGTRAFSSVGRAPARQAGKGRGGASGGVAFDPLAEPRSAPEAPDRHHTLGHGDVSATCPPERSGRALIRSYWSMVALLEEAERG